jgi:chromosome segregation ATPase
MELDNQVQSAHEINDNLREKLQSYMHLTSQIEKKNKTLVEQNNELSTNLEKYIQEEDQNNVILQELQKVVRNLSGENATYQAQLNDVTKEYHELEKMSSQSMYEYRDKMKDYELTIATLQERAKLAETLSKKYDEIVIEKDTHVAKYVKLNNTVETFQQENEKMAQIVQTVRQQYNKKCAEYDQILSQLEDQKKSSEEYIEQVVSNIEPLKTKSIELQQTIDTLNNEAATSKVTIEKMLDKIREQQQASIENKEHVDKLEETIYSLNTLIKDKDVENQSLKEWITDLQQNIKLLNVDLSSMETKYNESLQSIQEIEKKFETSSKEWYTEKERLEQSRNNLSQLNENVTNQLNQVQFELESVKTSLTEKSDLYTELKRNYGEKETLIEELYNTNNSLKSFIDTTTIAKTQLETKYVQMQKEYEKQIDKLSNEKDQLEKLELRHKEVIKELEEQVIEVNKKLNDKSQMVAQLQNYVDQQSDESEHIKKQLSSHIKTISMLENDIDKYINESSEKNRLIVTIREKLEQSIFREKNWTKQIEDAASRYQKLSDDTSKRVEMYTTQKQELVDEIDRLKNDMLTLRKKCSSDERCMKQLKEKHEDDQKQIQTLQEDNNRKKLLVKQAREQLEPLHLAIEECESKLTDYEHLSNENKRKITNYENQLKRLQADLCDTENKLTEQKTLTENFEMQKAQLVTKLQDMKETHHNLAKQGQEYMCRIDELEKSLELKIREPELLKEKCKRLRDENINSLHTYTKQIKEYTDELEKEKENTKQLQSKLESVTNQLQYQKNLLDETTKTKDELKHHYLTQLNEQARNVEKLQRDITDKDLHIEQLEYAKKSYISRLSTTSDKDIRIQELEQQISGQQEEIRQLQTSSGSFHTNARIRELEQMLEAVIHKRNKTP